MLKYFNTTGLCFPEIHYMVDPFRGLKDRLMHLVHLNQYFVIHAPWQTGKTTLSRSLVTSLNEEGHYIAVHFSIEEAGVRSVGLDKAQQIMIKSLIHAASACLEAHNQPPKLDKGTHDTLASFLRSWAKEQEKPIVVLIDEVNVLYDDVLISLLRQLKNGFQNRPQAFPASIGLVSLFDIREYPSKTKSKSSSGINGAFNIKAESLKLGGFDETELHTLLKQHSAATGQTYEEELIPHILALTGGQPWLTNALLKLIWLKGVKEDHRIPINLELLEKAGETLIRQRSTHRDILIEKLEDPRVKDVVMAILTGNALRIDPLQEALPYCFDLGIIDWVDGEVSFANDIYREMISRELSFHMQVSFGKDIADLEQYLADDGSLDVDLMLKAFQRLYRLYGGQWINRYSYKEAAQQLLLMAFVQRIFDGHGRIRRKMAIGRGATDLLISWKNKDIVLSLKFKHRQDSREEGLIHLSSYLEQLCVKRGYLILFDLKRSSEVSWEDQRRWRWQEEQHDEKTITVIEM